MATLQQIIEQGVQSMYKKIFDQCILKPIEDSQLQNTDNANLKEAMKHLKQFKVHMNRYIVSQLGLPMKLGEVRKQQPPAAVISEPEKKECQKNIQISRKNYVETTPQQKGGNPFLNASATIQIPTKGTEPLSKNLAQSGPLTIPQNPFLTPQNLQRQKSAPLNLFESSLNEILTSEKEKPKAEPLNTSVKSDNPFVNASSELIVKNKSPETMFSKKTQSTDVQSDLFNSKPLGLFKELAKEPLNQAKEQDESKEVERPTFFPSQMIRTQLKQISNKQCNVQSSVLTVKFPPPKHQPILNSSSLQLDIIDQLTSNAILFPLPIDQSDDDSQSDQASVLTISTVAPLIPASLDNTVLYSEEDKMKFRAQRVSAELMKKMNPGIIESFNNTCQQYYPSNYFHVGPRYQMITFLRDFGMFVEKSKHGKDEVIPTNTTFVEIGKQIIGFMENKNHIIQQISTMYFSSNYFHVGPRREMFQIINYLIGFSDKLRKASAAGGN